LVVLGEEKKKKKKIARRKREKRKKDGAGTAGESGCDWVEAAQVESPIQRHFSLFALI
jgi:hypothetical protein